MILRQVTEPVQLNYLDVQNLDPVEIIAKSTSPIFWLLQEDLNFS